jgi:Flp pilus assembly protein TadG
MACKEMMKMKNSKIKKSARGSTMVEFALSITIMLAMMLGLIDFARMVYAYHAIANVAREATRFASIRGKASCSTVPRTFPTETCPAGSTEVTNFVSSQLTGVGIYNNTGGGFTNRGDLVVTSTWPGNKGDNATTPTSCLVGTTPTSQDPGCVVVVQVQYKFGFTIPFWAFFQNSAKPAALSMTSTAQASISQ